MQRNPEPSFSVTDNRATPGPLLQAVLDAQRADDQLTMFPILADLSVALLEVCINLGDPLVWPIGPAADRLVGAATLTAQGALRVRGWGGRVDNEKLLLVTIATAAHTGIIQAARHARALGAREVYACGAEIPSCSDPCAELLLDGYRTLEIDGPVADPSIRFVAA